MSCNPLDRFVTVNKHVAVDPAGTVKFVGILDIVVPPVVAVGISIPSIPPEFAHATNIFMVDGQVSPGHTTLHGIGHGAAPH